MMKDALSLCTYDGIGGQRDGNLLHNLYEHGAKGNYVYMGFNWIQEMGMMDMMGYDGIM